MSVALDMHSFLSNSRADFLREIVSLCKNHDIVFNRSQCKKNNESIESCESRQLKTMIPKS